MKNKHKIYSVIALLAMFTAFSFNSATASNVSKQKLLNSIISEQQNSEDEIVKLWISGDRGNKLELAVANYLSLEVRCRALGSDIKNKSILKTVSGNSHYKPDSTIDLAREIVVEYFKRKGIDLKDSCFVKGTYELKLNKCN